MFDIFSGIGGLKKINSLSKAKTSLPSSSIEREKPPTALNEVVSNPKNKNVILAETKLNSNILINGDKEIRSLIHKRMLCEEAVRLKREIRDCTFIFFQF